MYYVGIESDMPVRREDIMTQRQFNQLDSWERECAIRDAADEVNAALNLFGADESPIADLVTAGDESAAQRAADRLLAPECYCRRGNSYCRDHHSAPAWWMAERAPVVRRLRRLVVQSLRA